MGLMIRLERSGVDIGLEDPELPSREIRDELAVLCTHILRPDHRLRVDIGAVVDPLFVRIFALRITDEDDMVARIAGLEIGFNESFAGIDGEAAVGRMPRKYAEGFRAERR